MSLRPMSPGYLRTKWLIKIILQVKPSQLLVLVVTCGLTTSEACDMKGYFAPIGSSTKSEVSWEVIDPSARLAVFQLKRYVAVSPTPKYMSFAFSPYHQMGPTDLVIDCYETRPNEPRVGTSKNSAYHSNTRDPVASSEVRRRSAYKLGTELSCYFEMTLPRDPVFILLAAGAMSNGEKRMHAEMFISEQLSGFACLELPTTEKSVITSPASAIEERLTPTYSTASHGNTSLPALTVPVTGGFERSEWHSPASPSTGLQQYFSATSNAYNTEPTIRNPASATVEDVLRDVPETTTAGPFPSISKGDATTIAMVLPGLLTAENQDSSSGSSKSDGSYPAATPETPTDPNPTDTFNSSIALNKGTLPISTDSSKVDQPTPRPNGNLPIKSLGAPLTQPLLATVMAFCCYTIITVLKNC